MIVFTYFHILGFNCKIFPFCQEIKFWLFRLESIFGGNVFVREELVIPLDECSGFLCQI